MYIYNTTNETTLPTFEKKKIQYVCTHKIVRAVFKSDQG